MKIRKLKDDKYKLALYYLEQKLGKSHIINNPDEDYRFCCPKCRHKNEKLVVTFQNKEYPNGCYHCWTCGDKGNNIYQLFYNLFPSNHFVFRELFEYVDSEPTQSIRNEQKNTLLNKLRNIKNNEESLISSCVIPPEYIKYRNLTYNNINTEGYTFLKNYLQKRMISPEDIIKYDIHFDINSAKLLFPSYSIQGSLNYFVTHCPKIKQYILGDVKKSKIIWNELFINWSKPVVLVEGIYDAITVGDNAIPLLSSSVDENYEVFKRICKHRTPVYLGLDMDVPDSYKYKVARLFENHGIITYILNWTQKDANETGKLKIKDVIDNKQRINWETETLKKKIKI